MPSSNRIRCIDMVRRATVYCSRLAADNQLRATLAASILGSSLAFIDGSVVNVALPALAHGLHAEPSDLSWAINAYLLPLGALILLGGTLGDHFGRRRLFLIGLLLFAAASILCAVAPHVCVAAGWSRRAGNRRCAIDAQQSC